MSANKKYELYFDGDLSRYYEYVLLYKENDVWVLTINYTTPEKSGRTRGIVDIGDGEIEAYAAKAKALLKGYHPIAHNTERILQELPGIKAIIGGRN